ncbi:MAG: carbamoyltransferase C-terminal domain-containing protein, partial [Candidatus Omnitrophota bacterium]
WCLKFGKIGVEEIDCVAFYDNGIKERLKSSFSLKNLLGCKKKIVYFSQEDSYLASAFYPSCFQDAAVLVNDGSKVKTVFARGGGNRIEILSNHGFTHSLGVLYSAVTHYLGFKVDCDEYKIMGLSAYGKPKYRDMMIKNRHILSRPSRRFTERLLSNIFAVKPREEDAEITTRHMDIAASVQAVIEEEILKQAEYLYGVTGCENICLSGSMALNCLANTKIMRQGCFKNIWIQPAAGDAGGALGAALLAWHKHLGNIRQVGTANDMMKSGFLGPFYSDNDIEEFLSRERIPFSKLEYPQLPDQISDLIAMGKVVGWFQGRMEFGPRALGARSILADSRNYNMHDRINLKVKFREPFRPLAPVVLAEKSAEYFDLGIESPYMLLVSQVKAGRREGIPAVVHIDNSSRIQTIKKETHPLYYDTIKAFYGKTGCPVVINTSFNVRGEPIVCSPEDAFRCFLQCEMDYLVMGSFLLNKRG